MTKNWNQLSPGSRRAITIVGTAETALKVAALIDLWRRPASQVHGAKWKWAAAITVINSAGLLPIVYFLRGRS